MKNSVSKSRRLLRSLWLAAPLVLTGHAIAHADTSMSRGHYLAIAADCAACHTNGHEGAELAGGYAIASPMGAIYSTNITPSKTYGIGNYTLEQFSRAIRHGVRADGAELYPAMPYGSYSQLTDEDVAALYDYLMHEVKPVDQPAPKTNLPFPFSIRASLWGWKLLSGVEGKPFVPDSTHDAAWNRGRYLVDTLAHCGECHTPRNIMMAPKSSAYLAGGDLGSWRAPNVTSDKVAGIGGWSDQELQDYLRTGKSAHARAAGPMAEAVEHSFQYLTPTDLAAMVAYLKTVPAIAEPGQATANFAHDGKAAPFDYAAANARRNNSSLKGMTEGNVLYEDVCASCHQSNGKGSADGYYPSLIGNTTTGQRNPADLVASILFGVDRTVEGHQVLMPGFGAQSLVQRLDDQQVAAIANYVTGHFGSGQATVTADTVATIRAGGPKPAIAQLSEPRVLAVLAIVGLVILGALALALRFILKSRRAA
ncbi:cytochrome c [Gluconacetobacter aggeris]|uniref:Cytochrome c n=1 Tax=Gluconacetobacter aggeris TaxID=1286186 RepID=A0A7W4NZM7_9PROT|nr:cytochrome c [Gluconacetobacter aggeris]MBB2168810.1 cytochrome c [Gluconacetobacter aggeris]